MTAHEDTGRIYGLSCACHQDRGVRYVGLTRQTIERRLVQHVSDSVRGSRLAVHEWIRSHGASNIQVTLLEKAPAPTLASREVYWIDYLGTYQSKKGLNLTPGGENPAFTDEIREKMSRAAKSRWTSESAENRTKRLQTLSLNAKSQKGRIGSASARQAWTANLPVTRGADHYRAKISESDATYVYYASQVQGVTKAQIARRIGASHSLVSDICNKKSWRHLTDSLDKEWGLTRG